MKSNPKTDPCAIAIVAYPGVQMSAVMGLDDLFTIANSYSEKQGARQLQVVEVTATGANELPESSFKGVILPPTLSGVRGKEEYDLQEWLRAQHKDGAVMCSICGGAFWLGYSGLLKGRPATTHWLLEDSFRAEFPQTLTNAEALLIDDHDIVTAGGLMAWLDLGLFIVKRFLGPQIMSQTARHLLIDPSGREQKNYRSFTPPLTHGDHVVLQLQHWLEGNAAEDLTVKAMSAKTNLSERTFLRRFKKATGYTPSIYTQNLRIEKARGLLERTRTSVAEISWQVGYGDASAFSRIFKTYTGLSAREYRKRFGVSGA